MLDCANSATGTGVPAGAPWLRIQAWRHPEGVAIAFAPPAEAKKDLPRLPLMGWEKAFRRWLRCRRRPPSLAVSYSPSQTLCANYKVPNLRLWTEETGETYTYIKQERVLVHTRNLCSLTCCPIHTTFLITAHLFFFFLHLYTFPCNAPPQLQAVINCLGFPAVSVHWVKCKARASRWEVAYWLTRVLCASRTGNWKWAKSNWNRGRVQVGHFQSLDPGKKEKKRNNKTGNSSPVSKPCAA